MKSLFEGATLNELKNRLTLLKPESERQWGKMDPSQMLAHCSAWMEMASGRTHRPRSVMGYIFGRLAKRSVLSEQPIRRNMPTEESLIVDGKRDFASERERLKECMDRFTSGGSEKCTTHPHCFFGPMTPSEWARLAYKHLDHHFRQFGI